MTKQLKQVRHSLVSQISIIVSLWAIMLFAEAVDSVLFINLDQFGIRPRDIDGLIGIVFAPFLHGSFSHLFSNSVPFLVLGWLILVRSQREFWLVTITVWVSSGLGAWLLGAPNTVHIGASGVVFGYFGFLIVRMIFDRHWLSALIGALVVSVYGTIIFGVLPFQLGISWQGHLFGFIGGVWAARQLVRAQ